MRNILIILFISQSVFSQTKEESIDWLNINLGTFGENTIMGTYQIELKYDTDYGEYLVFTNKSWNPLLQKSTYQYYTVIPKDISNIILSGKSRTNSTLDIFIISKSNKIYRPKTEDYVSEIEINMKNGNNEMTKRIQTGLLHLFESMGNKIEPPKELFKN